MNNSLPTLSPAVTTWVHQSLGSNTTLRSIQPAKGATSSSVYLVDALVRDRPLAAVLRLLTNAEWLEDEPDLAEHEAAVLVKVHRANLLGPELINYAPDASQCGVPAVLMTKLPGRAELHPPDMSAWLRQMAEQLAAIHAVPAHDLHWDYFSWTDVENVEPPTWSKDPQIWTRAIEIRRGQAPDNLGPRPTLLHRDFHPMNLLWCDGRLCGIVDWINGCRGPAGVDVAHCRRNLVSMYGISAAQQFLDFYQAAAGSNFVYDPYWEIDSLLDTLPEPGPYPPWQEFGLRLSENEVRTRMDAWMARLMTQF